MRNSGDVDACFNLLLKALGGDRNIAPSHPELELDGSPVPLGSNGAHDPCVEWLVITMNRGVEDTTRPRKT